MDFVYDKPIFTQWTFAPAEPQKQGKSKKKAHGHVKSLNGFDGIAAATGKGKRKVVDIFLRSHNTFGTESLSATDKIKFLKWLEERNFDYQKRPFLEVAKNYEPWIKDWRKNHR